MSLAWTTLALVLFLLPGLAFLIGVYSHDRYSRELGKGGTISDLGLATVFAILVHVLLLGGIDLFIYIPSAAVGLDGFSLARFVIEIVAAKSAPATPGRALAIGLYVILSAGAGFGAGWMVGRGAVNGLVLIAKHRWPQEITSQQRAPGGFVFAFVLTDIGSDYDRLVYRGAVEEFFVGSDGKISYLALVNCFKGWMGLGSQATELADSDWRPVLRGLDTGPSSRTGWHRFMIEGQNIVNVLFTRTPQIEADLADQDLDRLLATGSPVPGGAPLAARPIGG
jgi:hypothetical protein